MSYHSEFQKSVTDPNAFWADRAKDIHWFKEPTSIVSNNGNFYRWFEDGMLNTAYLCLDHHVEQGRGDQAALIYDSPVTNTKAKYTFQELRDQVALFAGALTKLGVRKGDRVVIYMPMVPQAVVAMLACARIGAIHSVVFGGFAARELAVRIDDAKPKVVVSASCGIEFSKVIEYKPLLDRAIEKAEHKPEHCIVFQRPQAEASMVPGRDLTWDQALDGAEPADCVPLEAGHPLYILYTSGTTGKPKGIVRDNGGHAVALKYSMKAIYGVDAGDVYWAASDVGWVVGHSYIVYGPLLAGCSTILFEGKPVRTPDPGTFWRIMSEYKVKSFFTAPTAFRAVKKEDPEGKFKQDYDLSNLKYVFLAGERLDPPTYHWLENLLGLPVLDHWWQTETGWAIVGNMVGIEPLPVRPGSATVPAPGFDVRILDEDSQEIPAGKYGDIVIKLPLPPGCLPTLWNDDARFEEAYLSRHPGYYLTGDGGYKDEDGYVFIMGRTDDVINVAGHRLSTGEIEELVARHPAVAECAVMGVADDLRGQVPAGFVVLKDGQTVTQNQLETTLVQMVRGEIGPFACFKQAAVVQRLPKTRSGKILRGIMKKIADGEPFAPPSTIDDIGILDEIKGAMSEYHIGRAFQEAAEPETEPAFLRKKISKEDLSVDKPQLEDQTPEKAGFLSLKREDSGTWRMAAALYLADRPGELADVSSYLAGHGANIEFFFYNRSENPNLVRIKADCPTAASAGALADGFQTQGRLDPPEQPKARPATGADVTDLSGLLKIKITLEDKPGTLAAFARILKEHQANVIYMSYD
ncbi:MAG: acetate--CoA ligase, partial [Thermodesulfobacteriota bacterium]|nr:acetate--CoA ligase [Thermodesulfobacteriota bacterium]